MTGPIDEQLHDALREAAAARALAAGTRNEADRLARRLEVAERHIDELTGRGSVAAAGNHDLFTDLTNIITTAEASGSYAEIAARARTARARLPREGL